MVETLFLVGAFKFEEHVLRLQLVPLLLLILGAETVQQWIFSLFLVLSTIFIDDSINSLLSEDVKRNAEFY